MRWCNFLTAGSTLSTRCNAATCRWISMRLLPPIASYPAVAQSGLMRYVGRALPADMRDNLFSAEHNTRKISRHILSPKQASYSVQDVDFVTTDDPNVHFSDVLEDADGSLLMIDTGSWYVHHCPTGHILTRPRAEVFTGSAMKARIGKGRFKSGTKLRLL